MRHARAMRRLFNAICLQSVVLVGCGAPLAMPHSTARDRAARRVVT